MYNGPRRLHVGGLMIEIETCAPGGDLVKSAQHIFEMLPESIRRAPQATRTDRIIPSSTATLRMSMQSVYYVSALAKSVRTRHPWSCPRREHQDYIQIGANILPS